MALQNGDTPRSKVFICSPHFQLANSPIIQNGSLFNLATLPAAPLTPEAKAIRDYKELSTLSEMPTHQAENIRTNLMIAFESIANMPSSSYITRYLEPHALTHHPY
jgi:hypothetical protein